MLIPLPFSRHSKGFVPFPTPLPNGAYFIHILIRSVKRSQISNVGLQHIPDINDIFDADVFPLNNIDCQLFFKDDL
jgi:hypothetical protein